MTFRADISIDWSLSPRIITVATPSAELSVKDLFDTLRTLEAESMAMDEPSIVDAGGYESLGGGVVVGLTVTLKNALIAFEDRVGPSFEQCFISGGNLVALQSDLITYFTTPVSPTAYTQIVMANSSSATQSDLDALQYGSFQNGVWIDSTTATSGTDFPSGTREFPINNATDAIQIANMRGFDTLYILGNYNFTAAHNVDGMTIIGQNAVKTAVIIDAGALANKVEIFECAIFGTLDGGSTLRECVITNLAYINGYVTHCIITAGTILLGGNATAYFIECKSGVTGVGSPIIDCGGSGQSLAIRDYHGGVTITNKTGAESVSIDLGSGQVILTSTVTAGEIVVRGDGKLVDESGNHILSGTWNGATILNETTSVLHQHTLDSIANAVLDAVA